MNQKATLESFGGHGPPGSALDKRCRYFTIAKQRARENWYHQQNNFMKKRQQRHGKCQLRQTYVYPRSITGAQSRTTNQPVSSQETVFVQKYHQSAELRDNVPENVIVSVNSAAVAQRHCRN